MLSLPTLHHAPPEIVHYSNLMLYCAWLHHGQQAFWWLSGAVRHACTLWLQVMTCDTSRMNPSPHLLKSVYMEEAAWGSRMQLQAEYLYEQQQMCWYMAPMEQPSPHIRRNGDIMKAPVKVPGCTTNYEVNATCTNRHLMVPLSS